MCGGKCGLSIPHECRAVHESRGIDSRKVRCLKWHEGRELG
jgi:hypothetical protein